MKKILILLVNIIIFSMLSSTVVSCWRNKGDEENRIIVNLNNVEESPFICAVFTYGSKNTDLIEEAETLLGKLANPIIDSNKVKTDNTIILAVVDANGNPVVTTDFVSEQIYKVEVTVLEGDIYFEPTDKINYDWTVQIGQPPTLTKNYIDKSINFIKI